jgi:hypothetical protein
MDVTHFRAEADNTDRRGGGREEGAERTNSTQADDAGNDDASHVHQSIHRYNDHTHHHEHSGHVCEGDGVMVEVMRAKKSLNEKQNFEGPNKN